MVGDRYKLDKLVHEVLEVNGNRELLKCIASDSRYGWAIGETFWDDTGWSGWEYLGNFSKSNRFKEIYDILNSEE
jgi:hypothetical protein